MIPVLYITYTSFYDTKRHVADSLFVLFAMSVRHYITTTLPLPHQGIHMHPTLTMFIPVWR